MALRLLIHYLGDIHQPLHCLTRVNPEFPHGDKGGNDFALKYHYKVNNLHSLWDAVMYAYHDSIKLVNKFKLTISAFQGRYLGQDWNYRQRASLSIPH